MIIGSFAVGAFASAWLSTLWNVRSVWVGCLLLIAIIPLMVRSAGRDERKFPAPAGAFFI